MTHLSLTGVTVTFGTRTAVRDISFASEPGELITLVGPNGAGKTTLLRAIASLVPSSGSISVGSERLDRVPPRTRARLLAYMPQSGVIAWPMRVIDVVALGRIPHEGSSSFRENLASIDQALHACNIAHLAETRIDRLSGGERVRVMLARTLAVDAPIMLLDEPVASLDPAQQLSVMDLLRAQADAGKIVIVVLHDLTLAARYATRAVLLSGGQLMSDGQPGALVENGDLGRAFGISIQMLRGESGISLHTSRSNRSATSPSSLR